MPILFIAMSAIMVLSLSCTKTIPDADLEAARIRSKILSRASSATIPDWVLPGPPCTFSNDLVLTKVYVAACKNLALAERMAARETGIQTSEQISEWVKLESGISNLRLDPRWCSNNAKILARYWEAWRPEGEQDRLYTLYLQTAFNRKILSRALSNEVRRSQNTNVKSSSLTNLFTR